MELELPKPPAKTFTSITVSRFVGIVGLTHAHFTITHSNEVAYAIVAVNYAGCRQGSLQHPQRIQMARAVEAQ